MIDPIAGRSRRGGALLSLALLGATALGAPARAETGFYFRQPGPGIGAPAAAVGEEEAPEASPANALAPVFRARYMKAGEAYAAETASTFQASGAAPFAWDARGLPPGTRLDETDNARPAIVGTPQAPGMFGYREERGESPAARLFVTAARPG